jgi:aminoglycoside phosphotransferase (APT) family kinase protein
MTPIVADLEAELCRRFGWHSPRVTRCDPIPEGHSGFTYWVTVANGNAESRYVLRLAPPGARPTGPADVARQGRIMAALHDAGLPVPAIPAASSRPVIDGRPYVLMEEVAGDRIEVAVGREEPINLATAAIAVLKRIHAVPIATSGISDEEVVPLTDELARWSRLMERGAPEPTQRASALAVRLAAAMPAERPPALVHADYHMGNMLFRGAEVFGRSWNLKVRDCTSVSQNASWSAFFGGAGKRVSIIGPINFVKGV